MRPYTIVKALALSLGALSVVARSLPEPRSELNIRAPGGKNDDLSVNNAASDTTPATTADVDDLKQRLERMGFVKVSEGILNGKVHTGTYSMPTNTTLSKRNTTFSKRGGKNYEGAFCASSCAPKKSIPAVNPDHCKEVYNELYSRAVQFSVNSQELNYFQYGDCGAFFVNKSPDTITYDFWDFGGTIEWLLGFCIIKHWVNFAGCLFEEDYEHPYIAVTHPSFYGI